MYRNDEYSDSLSIIIYMGTGMVQATLTLSDLRRDPAFCDFLLGCSMKCLFHSPDGLFKAVRLNNQV